ncbi:hypothetical protein L596_030215 [Steinernema carpocapsae]|uniref:Uncharacterized protein n=1 Tax=Steinernema carpocapsae TaxID=34508 RepID=A0A4U5LS25_STECR|nr:hypothetical protein L596_030215 [Steinernema carpocapsae]
MPTDDHRQRIRATESTTIIKEQLWTKDGLGFVVALLIRLGSTCRRRRRNNTRKMRGDSGMRFMGCE